MISETGKKTRMDKANKASINMVIGYLRNTYVDDFKMVDMVYLNDIDSDSPFGKTIGACMLTRNPVSPNEMICLDENNKKYIILNPHLENIEETVKGVLSTLYWEIHNELRKELYRLGYTPSEIKRAEPPMFSKLYANIYLDQQPGNPQINIEADDEDRGIIRYRNDRSKLTLHYLFCSL